MAGLVPGQSPGDVVQLGLIVREVREGNAGQQIVDPLLQHSPDGPDAARSLRTTSLGIDGMEVAIDFEGDVLRGFDHVLDGDDVGLTGEMIAALGATDRIHQAGTPQAQEDLLDRKSTRLNSSHANISYAVFCLKKKRQSTSSRGRWFTTPPAPISLLAWACPSG